MDIAAWLQNGSIICAADKYVWVGWGERNWQARPSQNGETPSFFFPEFFLKDTTPWFTHTHNLLLPLEQLQALLPVRKATLPYQWQINNQQDFSETFSDLQQKFASKELLKAVAYAFQSTPQKMTPQQQETSLLAATQHALQYATHLYGFWEESNGMLGATPEILFQAHDEKSLQTMACAGTYPSTEVPANVSEDLKNVNEHEIVIQGIVEALTAFGELNIQPMQLLRLPTLTHLLTPIDLKLWQPLDFDQIVKALHPTPALGAFPMLPGQKWLEAYQEKVERKRFGAPVGLLLPGQKKAICYVAIRNIQWDNLGISMGAGCGITASSHLEREWAEINLKWKAIKEMLRI